jgi:hypothetical protein
VLQREENDSATIKGEHLPYLLLEFIWHLGLKLVGYVVNSLRVIVIKVGKG